MSNYKRTTRFVKLYFRDQKKIMRAIPDITGMVSNDSLVKVYTHGKYGTLDTVIWECKCTPIEKCDLHQW